MSKSLERANVPITNSGDGTKVLFNDGKYKLVVPNPSGHQYNELATLGTDNTSTFWSPFRVTPNTINEDFTILTGSTATIGSFELSDGNTITIEDGANLVVL